MPHPEPGQVWVHSKTGNSYRVLHLATRECDLAPLVVYQRAGLPTAPVWVRPLAEWCQEVDGVPRFRLREGA
mgnify:CR=1 FL=1